jgi:hypothetical protein
MSASKEVDKKKIPADPDLRYPIEPDLTKEDTVEGVPPSSIAKHAHPTTARTCKGCGKPLVAIGRARANGKRSHDDWKSREYHKKCWKLLSAAYKRRSRPY